MSIDHIVLLNFKLDAESTKIATIITEINGLTSLNLPVHLRAGRLLRCASTSLNFSHMVYGRFNSTDDLQVYNYHPQHLQVAKNTKPILDDVMVVDWISNGINTPLTPGSVMRVTLLKLKEDLEKGKIVEGIISKLKTSEQISIGEDISRVMAKGYSIGMIAVFSDLEALYSDSAADLHKLKVNDFIESEVVVDYVVSSPEATQH